MTAVTGGLEGRQASLVLSDPFELAGDRGVPAEVTMVSVDSFEAGAGRERILAALPSPIAWRGTTYDFVAMEERHGHGLTRELVLGQPVECNIVGVTRPQAERGSPWGLDTWRGGLAAIGLLQLLPDGQGTAARIGDRLGQAA